MRLSFAKKYTYGIWYSGDATDGSSPPVHEVREHSNPGNAASKRPDEEPAPLLARTISLMWLH